MNDEYRWQAKATVTWFGVGEGGRASGPPTVSDYSPTVVFTSKSDEVAGVESLKQFSVVMGMVETAGHTSDVYLRFLAPDLVAGLIVPGAELLVMEGPKPVGKATIESVLQVP